MLLKSAVIAGVVAAVGLSGCGGSDSTIQSSGSSPTPTQTAASTPPPSSDSSQATEFCERYGKEVAGDSAALRAAFESKAGALRRWQENRHGPSGPVAVSDFIATRTAERKIFVCYFDGEFATPAPQGAPPHNRIRVFVDDSGEAALDAAGYHDTPNQGPGRGEMPLERPPAD